MAITGSWVLKDPNERSDYEIWWEAEMSALGNDTITASEWSVDDANLLIGSGGFAPSFTDTTTKVWLTAGLVGITYNVTNQITTAGGRILRQTVRLKVQAK